MMTSSFLSLRLLSHFTYKTQIRFRSWYIDLFLSILFHFRSSLLASRLETLSNSWCLGGDFLVLLSTAIFWRGWANGYTVCNWSMYLFTSRVRITLRLFWGSAAMPAGRSCHWCHCCHLDFLEKHDIAGSHLLWGA